MFRFTIRDVLWLTALVALAVGWWIDRERLRLWARDRYDRTEAALEACADGWAQERGGAIKVIVDGFYNVQFGNDGGEGRPPKVEIKK